jgi:DNA primase
VAGSRDAIEEIRNRLGILDVISEYVTLQRAGKGYKGLCPFHAEKTPSFTASEEFQTWHCFGCGEHGDIFSFVMKIERLNFAEALERLAKRAGVVLDTPQDQRPSRRELLAGINSLASTYYFELLKRSPFALEYLRDRGLADQTLEQFRLGYAAPSSEGLTGFLQKKGVDLEVAGELGLVRRGERGRYHDWFRHRVIFPIFDIQGRVIAFGGRAFGDDQPKYLNSPDTPVFSKTKALYGLNLARKNIAESGYAVVMEGYMDVITAHQAGFSQCVATLGTALTSEHVKVLARYAKKAVLAYDADSAGMKATLRSAPMFEEAECEVRIARLSSGEDPDSLIRKGRSSEFSAAITHALPVVEYKLSLLRDKYDLSTASGRGELLKEAAKILVEVTSLVERDRYIKELISFHPNWDVGQSMAAQHIHSDVNKLAMRQKGAPESTVRPRRSTSMPGIALEKAQHAVLRLLIQGGAAGKRIREALSPEDFPNEVCSAAARILFEKFSENEGIYLAEVIGSEGDVGAFLSELVMRDAEPVTDSVLEEYVLLIKNSRLRKARTSDMLAPYMRDGIIDPDAWKHAHTATEYEEFLKKTGRKAE